MNPRCALSPPDSRLVEAYEDMRYRHGCEGPGRAGYEVLRRQGLATWIEAFSGCVSPVASPPLSPPLASPTPDAASALRRTPGVCGWGVPEHLYPELTGLLAGLALGHLKEGVC